MVDLLKIPDGHCEGCSEEDVETTEKKTAVMFCVDCDDRLCETCVESHRRIRVFRNHRVVELGENVNDDISARKVKVFCDKHTDKVLELFCFECKAAICLMCFVMSHKSHNCSDVNVVADEYREQMKNDTKTMVETMARLKTLMKQQENKKMEFIGIVDKVERDICEQVKKLKQVLDREKVKLIDQLSQLRKGQVKLMEKRIEETEQHVSFIESLVKYTDELRSKGTASDVARQTSSLHQRAVELVNIDAVPEASNVLETLDIRFSATPLQQSGLSENLVGKLNILRLESQQRPLQNLGFGHSQADQQEPASPTTGK
jgi:hypothetical protein